MIDASLLTLLGIIKHVLYKRLNAFRDLTGIFNKRSANQRLSAQVTSHRCHMPTS